MHQPNDLTVAADGGVFLSDPDWKKNGGRVWYFRQGQKLPRIVAEDLVTPNGIELSPDGKHLFVGESHTRRIWKFRVGAGGAISDKRLLATVEGGSPDGMRMSSSGELWIAVHGAGSLARIDEDGTVTKFPTRGGKPSNLTLLPGRGDLLYVTEQEKGCVEILATSGRRGH